MLGDGGAEQTDAEQDALKQTLLDTNPYLLALTIAVSIVHSVFEFLAFKNGMSTGPLIFVVSTLWFWVFCLLFNKNMLAECASFYIINYLCVRYSSYMVVLYIFRYPVLEEQKDSGGFIC